MPKIACVLLCIVLVFPLHAWNSETSQLRRFVGEWKGSYRVETLTGRAIGVFRIERSCYWQNGHLMGATALELPDGTRQFEFSEVWHDGTVLRSIVESETKRMEYYGWMQHGSIWWQSHFDAKTTFHQLHIEQLRPTHHGFQLSLHGYRWTAFSNQPGFLRIHGELHRIQPEEVFEFLQMMPE